MNAEVDIRALVTRAWDAQYASPRDSRDWARQALEAAESAGDASTRAWASLTIGYFELRYASAAEARRSLEAALQVCEAIGDRRCAVLARNGLARVRMMEGDLPGALALFRENLGNEDGSLSTLDRFYTLNGIAGCLAALGDSPQSLGYLFEALGELRTVNARPQMATLLSNLGSELVAVGDCEEALVVLEEARTLAAELNHPRLGVGVVANLADCLVHLGRAQEALPLARRLMADPESPNISSPEGNVYTTAAFAFLKCDRAEEAQAALALAEKEAQRHGGPCLAWALYLGGLALARQEERDAAIARLEQAREKFEERTPLLLQGLVLELLADLLAQAGRAAEAYALHKEFFQVYERRLGLGTRARYYAVQIRYELIRLRDERDRAREEALHDPLTGLCNRRYLDSVLADLVSLFGRNRQPLAVAMLDLDYFKEVNDQFGHPFGDEVLKAVSRVLAEGTRAGDIVCRYGGEEFCLVFPNATVEDAMVRVESLLASTRAVTTRVGNVEKTGVTFSAGVVGFPADGETGRSLVDAADRVLYAAKNQGRGRVMR